MPVGVAGECSHRFQALCSCAWSLRLLVVPIVIKTRRQWSDFHTRLSMVRCVRMETRDVNSPVSPHPRSCRKRSPNLRERSRSRSQHDGRDAQQDRAGCTAAVRSPRPWVRELVLLLRHITRTTRFESGKCVAIAFSEEYKWSTTRTSDRGSRRLS